MSWMALVLELPSISNSFTKHSQHPYMIGKALVCKAFRFSTRLAAYFHSSPPVSQNVMHIFDRNSKISQRNRTARLPDPETYDYIRDEVASRLADRVCDISRKFTSAVDLGCGRGHLAKFLTSDSVGMLYQCDNAAEVLKQAVSSEDLPTYKVLIHEEHLPFRSDSLDLVLSSLSLHWVNNLPGILREVLRCLRNDGCFLGVMSASDTLFELRFSLQMTELERLGGFSPHISPFADNVDMGELMQVCGFNLITLLNSVSREKMELLVIGVFQRLLDSYTSLVGNLILLRENLCHAEALSTRLKILANWTKLLRKR
ncbi:unnamed protein product [Calicophoron daubneyi]|uniref:Arginine-hydroxylase NDUFAF5, mitochondrial n=1 Tax=Calicophoron daubneyi TaxID=300641 RepID=A0AAV2U0Q7_CALDB